MPHRRQLHQEYAAVMRELMASAVFFQDAVARAAGLNSTDLQALGVLVREGPLSPGELARRTGITAGGAITLLVDRLEAAGFAHRSRDDRDRRRVRITADEEQVDRRLAPLYEGVGREWDDYLKTLTPDELAAGIAQLRSAVEINRVQTQKMAGE
ncbi:MarR family transcriptional regulator [Nocardioides coralli]|uniref:MarR family transcriptional regulator n=1 Tax=Nocardioides coralli TaxID=2872154 RepID=UPI001CA3E2AD|nr:MarR family transcriptional regulator [Nocardioides coralli]QZY28991.1 MarR family transcriptional regulator [Nocardioides coralli]